ncbi:MAG: oligosaccharide flippase family protein [Sandaracinaceae bacterium]|nr:oligosaccharide flippase family protein [Sandaracinaceae bacterium]
MKKTGTSAGRGLVLITGAKIYFIITAYAIQFLLPRLLGSPEEFGFFRTAMSLVSILNNVLIAATVQTLSKKVSENDEKAPQALRQGLLLQLVWGGSLGLLMFVLAPLISRYAMKNVLFTPLLQVSSVVVIAYALYAALVGSLNGRRMFMVQARLDMTFSTLRSVSILGAAALGFGAFGAFAGFATSAAAILLIALFVVGTGTSGERSPWKPWIIFMAPLWIYQLCLNFILQGDILVLTSTITDMAEHGGMVHNEATALANRMAGFYGAAQTFAFVPYQLILSVIFIVFPLVAKATSSGDIEMTRTTIRRAMRFSWLVLLAMASPISGAARGVLRVVYKEEYLVADRALSILVLGLVAFALFVIAATVLSGAGRALDSAKIALVSLGVLSGSVYFFIRASGPNLSALTAAACGTSLGALIALVLAGALVYKTFGAFIPPLSVLRGAAAAAAAAAVAHFVPHGTRIMAIAALAAGFATYAITLVVIREIPPHELNNVRSLLMKRLGRR